MPFSSRVTGVSLLVLGLIIGAGFISVTTYVYGVPKSKTVVSLSTLIMPQTTTQTLVTTTTETSSATQTSATSPTQTVTKTATITFTPPASTVTTTDTVTTKLTVTQPVTATTTRTQTSVASTTTTTTSSTTSPQTGISYPTMDDELLDKDMIVMEFDMYFPSIDLSIVADMIKGSSACPCHITGVTQVGDAVQATSPGEESITMTPAIGYEKIMVAPTENMSTGWAGTPTVQPNDTYEIWQQNYSVTRFSGRQVPFLSPDNVGFNSYGKATMTRSGVTYHGIGNFWRLTATSGSDPYPVANLTSIWGVVSTPTFLLSTEKIVYTGGAYGPAFTQDLSEVAYTDGGVHSVQIEQTNASCNGETLSFTDPRTSTMVVINLSFIKSPTWDCSSEGIPGGEIPSVVSTGYYAWVRVHPSG